MNLFLHNIGDIDSDNNLSPADALIAPTDVRYDYVLANPPFGKNSSQTFTNEEGEQEKEDLTYNRQDFWATTSNKQLNFVQHIRSMLKSGGMAAVVVPDNVLFEGGAGETVRKKLLETIDVHIILRLPTGIFYANGVKANVIFFDNKPSSKDSWTKEIWFSDYRTNIHHTLKKNPLKLSDLQEFITCCYFAVLVNWKGGMQLPQVHKHVDASGNLTTTFLVRKKGAIKAHICQGFYNRLDIIFNSLISNNVRKSRLSLS